MSAIALLKEAGDAGLTLRLLDGNRLYVTPKPPHALRARLIEHKADLLRLLETAELPARLRVRFRDACHCMGLDSGPALAQFDRWRYRESELREMAGWPDEIIERHVRLLLSEFQQGINP